MSDEEQEFRPEMNEEQRVAAVLLERLTPEEIIQLLSKEKAQALSRQLDEPVELESDLLDQDSPSSESETPSVLESRPVQVKKERNPRRETAYFEKREVKAGTPKSKPKETLSKPEQTAWEAVLRAREDVVRPSRTSVKYKAWEEDFAEAVEATRQLGLGIALSVVRLSSRFPLPLRQPFKDEVKRQYSSEGEYDEGAELSAAAIFGWLAEYDPAMSSMETSIATLKAISVGNLQGISHYLESVISNAAHSEVQPRDWLPIVYEKVVHLNSKLAARIRKAALKNAGKDEWMSFADIQKLNVEKFRLEVQRLTTLQRAKDDEEKMVQQLLQVKSPKPKADTLPKRPPKAAPSGDSPKRAPVPEKVCYKCLKPGHIAPNCQEEGFETLAQAKAAKCPMHPNADHSIGDCRREEMKDIVLKLVAHFRRD